MSETAEGRGAFGGFIGPRTLMAQVENTAPWVLETPEATEARPAGERLVEMAEGPFGWRRILGHAERLHATDTPMQAAWADYLALCLAAHFGTAGTHVPTDVDTKIRGHLWFRLVDDAALGEALHVAAQLRTWDIRSVSARTLDVPGHGTISGHDGERLGVLAGALLRVAVQGDADRAATLEAEIESELDREVRVFELLAADDARALDLLRVAGNLVHNAGDLDQGLSAKEGRRVAADYRQRLGRLAHERFERHGGTFARAARINSELMAPEAHRHYPLRRIAELRAGPLGLRPAGPCLDAWGEALGGHDGFRIGAQGNLVAGFLHAEQRVKGQRGYARVLAGLDRALARGIDGVLQRAHVPTAAKRVWKDAAVRRKVAVPRASFEATMAKRVRALLAG